MQKSLTPPWLALIGVATLITSAAVVAPWIVVFHGPLSKTPQDWGAFGDYFGGVLSPILMMLTILVAFQTIRQQQREISQLSRESSKHDLLEIIKMVETDFQDELKRININHVVNGVETQLTGEDVLLRPSFYGSFKKLMKPMQSVVEQGNKEEQTSIDPNEIYLSETFSLAAGHLNQLRMYVQAYQDVSNNNGMTKYFERKYKLAFTRFNDAGFPIEKITFASPAPH